MTTEPRAVIAEGSRPLRAAVIQAHGTHDEIMPSLFDVLLANGVEPTGFLSDRIERRGDIFGPYTPYADRVHYGDFTDRDHWGRVAEQVADADLLVLNTMAYPGPANLAVKTGLPTIGIVHNPPMMLNNPTNVDLIRSGQCVPASLAPHVTSWMMADRPELLSGTVTLGAWMWQMPRGRAADGRRRIAVPGAVDFTKRDYVSIVGALPDLIAEHGRDAFVISVVGGGRDRLALEELVQERGLGDVFELAPLDAATGQVLSRDFYAGLAACDVLLPHLPTSQSSYRVFKISAAISCAVGFGIPAVLDRWTAASYRVPCRTYPIGDIVAGLRCAIGLTDDELGAMRADLAVERSDTIARATDEMARALTQLRRPPVPSSEGPTDRVVVSTGRPAVDPATIQRDDREAFLAFADALLRTSYSQRIQDIWALWESGFAVDGYYCEFGALGGKDFSNSYLLERVGWDGVVSEPHPSYTKALYANRRCAVSTQCVYDKTGETVSFHTVEGRPALSTIGGFGADDLHREAREHFVSHEIGTITLADLFDEAGAPEAVDFLSIDTEGSELVILRAYDFTSRPIRLICVEHNDVHREGLFELLSAQGYERKWPELSGHDDWYVLRGAFPDWSAHAMRELVDRADAVEPFVRDFPIRRELMSSLRVDPQDPRAQLGLPPWRAPAPLPGHDQAAARATYDLQRNLLKRLGRQQELPPRALNQRTQTMFHRLSRRSEPTMVLEIGAFEGYYSASMKRSVPEAEVIAFEANPHVYTQFHDALAAAGVDHRHEAVTNRPGAVDFHLPRDLRGGRCQPVNQVSSLHPHRGAEEHDVVRVGARRIDDLVDPEREHRVVAYISAGGACREVLEGMDRTLERTVAIFVQVESQEVWSGQWLERDVAAHLVARGFTLVGADRLRGDKELGLVFVNPRLARRRVAARIAADVFRPARPRRAVRAKPTRPAAPAPQTAGPVGLGVRGARKGRRAAARLVRRLASRAG